MIVKKYTCKVITTKYKSELKEEVNPPSSDLYLMKENGWLSYRVEVSDSLKDYLAPTLIDKQVYKNYVLYKVNTLNFDLTYIQSDGVWYKYKVVCDKPYSLKEVREYLKDYSVVSIKGEFYTNTLGYYSSEGSLLFTECVINRDTCEITYHSKYIAVKAPLETELLFRDSVLSPSIIDEYNIHIPSFYLTLEFKTIKCVDSNPIQRTETTPNRKTFQRFRVVSPSSVCSQALNMSFRLSEVGLQSSTHIFSLPKLKTTFYIQDDGSISTTDVSDYSFTVYKVLNTSKIHIIPNIYKDLYTATDVDVFLRDRVYSYYEVDSNTNNMFTRYISISNTYPTYNSVVEGYKSDNPNFIKTLMIRDKDEELDYVGVFDPNEISVNSNPSEFEKTFDLVQAGGVYYVSR